MPENHQITLKELKLYKQALPPWILEGEAVVLSYKFSKKWVEVCGQLPEHLAGKFEGGLGFIVLVNYHKSPIGPYREILLIPGKFKGSGKQTITKVYVSSETSSQNGRANWGFPKITLPISWNDEVNKTVISMMDGEKEVLSFQVKSGGISFPVSTSILPIDLHQLWDGVNFHIKPSGSGKGKLAKGELITLDSTYFPDINGKKPLFTMKIDPFRIEFPVADYDL
jgi:hypothetical protein